MERKRLDEDDFTPPPPPKKKGGRPRTVFASPNAPQKVHDRINRRYELTPEKVCEAIIKHRGMLTEIAEDLGVRRLWLRNYIADRKPCIAQLKEAREEMGDVAEKKLYELIEAGHFPAITFYLSTVHRNRGYGLGRNAQLPGVTNNVINQIESVNIVTIPSGTYLSAEDIKQLAPTIDAAPIQRLDNSTDNAA